MSNDCIFCKIIAGEIPSTKVYEDEFCYAFDDIEPEAPVHTLIVPKTHYDELSRGGPRQAHGDGSQGRQDQGRRRIGLSLHTQRGPGFGADRAAHALPYPWWHQDGSLDLRRIDAQVGFVLSASSGMTERRSRFSARNNRGLFVSSALSCAKHDAWHRGDTRYGAAHGICGVSCIERGALRPQV